MPKIIGFGHRRRTGKDKAADFAKSHISITQKNLKMAKVGLSDPLKASCEILYGWAGLKHGDYYEKHPEERNVILPQLGLTPVEIWVEASSHLTPLTLFCSLLDSHKNLDVILIKDVRRPEEADAILSSGGKVYKLIRDSAPKGDDFFECALDDYNCWSGTIDNNGTLRQLNDQVVALMEELFNEE